MFAPQRPAKPSRRLDDRIRELGNSRRADGASIREYCHIVAGVFTPVLAKHSMSFSLIDCLSVGVIEVVALYDAARSSSVRMQMVVAIRVAYVKTSWVGPLRADEHSESLQSWAT